MRTIKEIEDDMKVLIEQIDGEDAAKEVAIAYPSYEVSKNLLLNSENLDDYLVKYDELYKDGSAVLECFSSTSSEALKSYIEKNIVDFDALKTETVSASCEALKFLIYEAEDEEY